MLFFRTLNGSIAFLRLCTFLLITVLDITFQLYILYPQTRPPFPSSSRTHILVFNLCVLYIFWTFILACQDPGRVMSSHVPSAHEQIRYCVKCRVFKPPRTHHCKKCARCVLRMDHHCPWLSSCIGYDNHAYFIKFLASVVPTLLYLTYVTIQYLLHEDYDAQTLAIGLALAVTAGCVCLMVSCLLFYQVWCAIENITTIESWTLKRTEDAIRRKLIPDIAFPYDLYSLRDNLREIFGDGYMVTWVWPTIRARGSGHVFRRNEDADDLHPWPPTIPEPQKDKHTVGDVNGHDSEMREGGNGLRARTKYDGDNDDMTWDDEDEAYTTDDSDDYVDGDGENLESYGVDDDDELHDLQEIAKTNDRIARWLAQKRDDKIRKKAESSGMVVL